MISKWEFGDFRSISGCFRIRQDITCPKSKGYAVAGDFTGISWSQFHTLVIFSDMSTNKNCDMPANLQRMSLRALVPVPEHEKVSNAAFNDIPMPLNLLVFILLIRCTTNILASFVPFPVTICAACVVRLAASESFPINVFTLPVKRWKVLNCYGAMVKLLKVTVWWLTFVGNSYKKGCNVQSVATNIHRYMHSRIGKKDANIAEDPCSVNVSTLALNKMMSKLVWPTQWSEQVGLGLQ